MKLESYRKVRGAVAALMGACVAMGVIAGEVFVVIAGVMLGLLILYVSGRKISEIAQDERSALIRSKAASATLGIAIVGMAAVGLLMVLLGRQGLGDYEQVGYLLAYQACIVLGLNAFFGYYYRARLGG